MAKKKAAPKKKKVSAESIEVAQSVASPVMKNEIRAKAGDYEAHAKFDKFKGEK